MKPLVGSDLEKLVKTFDELKIPYKFYPDAGFLKDKSYTYIVEHTVAIGEITVYFYFDFDMKYLSTTGNSDD